MNRPSPSLQREAEKTLTLMQVAMGNHPAHMALINANVLNVYTGELLENLTLCTFESWIAYVGKEPGHAIGDQTEVIDVEGKTVIPGFIDGHAHLAWLASPEAFLKYAASGGTTTIITETMEPYPVGGLSGVKDFLDGLKDQPIKILATAPAMVSISRAARGISDLDLDDLLKREDIVGLGESYWQAVLQDPEMFLGSIMDTLRHGKTLEGHTAGANEKKLMAYLAAGISSCHEPIKAEEVLQRLRLGIHVMIREGSIRKDLEQIAPIKDLGVATRRLILVSDGIEPGELMGKGYMEHIVQRAIQLGFDPVSAIQMATLNVAEHFRLDHLIGGLAPGRFADMVVIPDLRTIRAECVVSSGKVIARNGKLLLPPRRHRYHPESLTSIRIKENIQPEAFAIRVPHEGSSVKVRAIEMVTELVTREMHLEVPVHAGYVEADGARGLAKVAAIDRTLSPGKMFTGLIKGLGLKSGALACSAAWDTTDIIVAGASDQDMALAVNRIIQTQGGAVVCENSKILQELPLPIFGIMSPLPLEEVDLRIKSLAQAAFGLGVPFPDPILTLIVLTGAAIPFIRICEEGLVDIKTGETLGLFLE
jgi:adenine deaminase